MEKDNLGNSDEASKNEVFKKDIENLLQRIKRGRNDKVKKTLQDWIGDFECELNNLQLKLHPLDPYSRGLNEAELILAEKYAWCFTTSILWLKGTELARDITPKQEKDLNWMIELFKHLGEDARRNLRSVENELKSQRNEIESDDSKQTFQAPVIEKKFEDYIGSRFQEKLIPYIQKLYGRAPKIMVAAMIIALKNLEVLKDTDLLTRRETAELINKFFRRSKTKCINDRNLERPFNIYNAKDKKKQTGKKKHAFVTKVELVQNLIGQFINENNLVGQNESAEIL